MDKFHADILKFLKQDCRISHKRLADALGAKESEVTAAIEEMEKSGIIMRYTVTVDESRVEDYFVEAYIEVKVSPVLSKGFDAIAEEIYAFPEVKSLYLMSGGYDLAVIIEGKTLKEVALFVSERLSVMDKVLSTATHFILKKYKIDGELTSVASASRLSITP